MLDNADTRRRLLRRRLAQGEDLSAGDLVREFGVSDDTIRRDLLALESAGAARRVRGGAMPVADPAPPLAARQDTHAPLPEVLLDRALAACGDARTLLIDGGWSALAVARRLMPVPDRLVITPSPWVATVTTTAGIETVTLGGRISARGGIATGRGVEAALTEIAGSVAILGACGLHPEFGLSSDEVEESAVKRAMALAADRTMVVAGGAKLGRRARHRTLAPDAIFWLVTDATDTSAYAAAGMEVIHG